MMNTELADWLSEPVLTSGRAWLTLLFAGVAAYVGLSRHLRDRRSDRSRRSDRWTLRKSHRAVVGEPRPLLLELRLADAQADPVRLNTLRVVAPRGARIARTEYEREWRNKSGYRPATFEQSLIIERDLSGDERAGSSPSIAPDSTVQIFVAMPSRPFWSRGSRARIRISVDAEEMSSQRSAIRLQVMSHPIAWASSSADIAK